MTEGGEEGEGMHVNEDYWNYSYQPASFTSDPQQQIEEDLTLMKLDVEDVIYPYEYKESFEKLQEPQLPPKSAFINRRRHFWDRLHPRS